MTRKGILALEKKEDVQKIRDAINLTDRQFKIFDLYFVRRWAQIDIAFELNVCELVIQKECKIIKEKLKYIRLEDL